MSARVVSCPVLPYSMIFCRLIRYWVLVLSWLGIDVDFALDLHSDIDNDIDIGPVLGIDLNLSYIAFWA